MGNFSFAQKGEKFVIKKLLLFMSIFLIVGCATPQPKVVERINGYTPITVQEFLKKNTDKEDFVLVLTSKQCSHCNELTDFLKKQEKLENVFYIELSESNQVKNEVKKLFPDLKGTPTILRFEKGEIKSIVEGYNQEKLIKLLKGE